MKLNLKEQEKKQRNITRNKTRKMNTSTFPHTAFGTVEVDSFGYELLGQQV
jgi:hypothetical protein